MESTVRASALSWPELTCCFIFKEFERSEIADTESSWFVWFKTEYELAKFEHALLEAWRELFQVCICFWCYFVVNICTKVYQQTEKRND